MSSESEKGCRCTVAPPSCRDFGAAVETQLSYVLYLSYVCSEKKKNGFPGSVFFFLTLWKM